MTIRPQFYASLIDMNAKCECAHNECDNKLTVKNGYCYWHKQDDNNVALYVFCSTYCYLDAIIPDPTMH